MEGELRRLAHAQQAVVSDPEIMSGTPVYRGTRIPVHAIAGMLAQGTTIEEILVGYPALTRERVELAPVYGQSIPPPRTPSAAPVVQAATSEGHRPALYGSSSSPQ